MAIENQEAWTEENQTCWSKPTCFRASEYDLHRPSLVWSWRSLAPAITAAMNQFKSNRYMHGLNWVNGFVWEWRTPEVQGFSWYVPSYLFHTGPYFFHQKMTILGVPGYPIEFPLSPIRTSRSLTFCCKSWTSPSPLASMTCPRWPFRQLKIGWSNVGCSFQKFYSTRKHHMCKGQNVEYRFDSDPLQYILGILPMYA